jgi:carboxyvinyl-carboxyphosphonate phosphorylmutase
VLTLSEFAEQCYRICRAGNLPLLVDADHGYGNALNVKRTVEELESAGVAGLTIEDTVLPTPFAADKARFISIDEGVGKMRAALAGRQDPSLTVIGRTGAIQVNGLDDTIARVTAYAATGVDAIFLVGVRTRDDLEKIAAVLKIPIILGNAPAELQDMDYLASKGVRICLQGHLPIMAAVRAVHDTLKALRDGTAPGKIGGVASDELMKQVTRDASYKRWTKEFLGT